MGSRLDSLTLCQDPDEARKMMNRKDAPTYLKEITDHLLEVGVIDEVITVGMQQRLVAVRPVGEIGKKEKDQGGQAKADDDEEAGEEEEKAASAGAGGEGKSVKVEAGSKQAAPAPAEPRAAAAASGFAIPSLEEVEEEAEAAGSRAHVWEQGGLERARAAGKTESRAPEQRGPEIVRATEEEQAAAARVAREAAERVAKAGAGAAKKGPPHRKMELILVPYNFRVAATMLYTCDETVREVGMQEIGGSRRTKERAFPCVFLLRSFGCSFARRPRRKVCRSAIMPFAA